MRYSPSPSSGTLQHRPEVNCVWYIRLKKTFPTGDLKDNVVIKVPISQEGLGPNYRVLLSFETVKDKTALGRCLTAQNALSTCSLTYRRGNFRLQVTESRNPRMVGVGRDLCRSSSPTPCPSRVTQSRLHGTLARRFRGFCGVQQGFSQTWQRVSEVPGGTSCSDLCGICFVII